MFGSYVTLASALRPIVSSLYSLTVKLNDVQFNGTFYSVNSVIDEHQD